MTQTKVICFFNHLNSLPEEECDRHYVQVHVPFIIKMLESSGAACSYHTAKVKAQRDVIGTWAQRPEIWRSLAITASVAEGAESMERVDASVGDAQSRLTEQDHRRFLRNIRTYHCDERVLVEDLRGRPSTTKFTIDIGTHPGRFASVVSQVTKLIEGLERELVHATGIALALVNTVKQQGVARDIDEPGQGYAPGQFMGEPDTAAVFELYFDTRRNGERFIDRVWPALTQLSEAPGVSGVRCFRLEEECQLDMRDRVVLQQ